MGYKYKELIDSKEFQQNTAKVESEAYYIFGTLRQLTEEEKEVKRKSLAAISKPTGRNFFDFF